MPFQKGQSGNPAGRRKGSVNKVNKDRKEFISHILDLNTEGITVALEQLKETDPLAYINALLKLLEYDTPKLSRTTFESEQTMKFEPVKITMNSPKVDYTNMTVEELQTISDILKSKLEN